MGGGGKGIDSCFSHMSQTHVLKTANWTESSGHPGGCQAL